jgi:hypothetical protein
LTTFGDVHPLPLRKPPTPKLQVIDFIELFFDAHLVSNPSKALILKAFTALAPSFQQSYPQIF